MEVMCRCCLKTDISLIEITIEDEEKFKTCTDNKEFNKNDGLPQNCCSFCYKKVNDIFIFQEECKQAELFLRKLQLKNNIKSENNEINTWVNIYNDDTLKIENIENNIIDNPIEEILQIVNNAENKYLDENSQTSLNFETNFTCKKCKKSFKSKKNLNIHFTLAHRKNPDNKSFKCRICEYNNKNNIFGSERNLKIHLTRKHQTERRNETDSNSKILENKSLLLKHLKKSETIIEEELNDFPKNKKIDSEETLLTLHEPKSNERNHTKKNLGFITPNEIVQQERKKYFNKLPRSSKYHCDLCGIKFSQKQFLVTHFKVEHLKIMEFTCKLCWKGFVSYNLFYSHLIKIHIKQNINHVSEMDKYLISNESDNSNYLWKDLKFPDTSTLNKIEYNYRCRLCDKSLNSKILLKFHFSSVHLKLTNISYKCNICWKIFRFKYSFLQHCKIHRHMRYKHFKNTENITSNSVLRKKINSFYQWPPNRNKLAIQLVRYNCDYCNNTFGTDRALKEHLQRKHEKYIIPNQLECSICNIIFSKHHLFRNHMKDNHPGEYSLQIQVNCTICKKSYSKKSIKEHLKTHQNRPKHIQCPECGRTFFSKSTYSYHQKTHSNEKPFKCDHCSKAFITKYQLVMHSITHSGIERPKRYQCNFCGKGCASTSEFTVHLRIHTKERPFKCTQCDKGFLTKSHLRNHFVTHTGEKNYQCKEDGCKSAYSSVSSLKKHYYMVHCPEDQKKFQCDLCLKRFGRRTFLNQHRKAHGKIAKFPKN